MQFRYADLENQQRNCDGKDAIAESLESSCLLLHGRRLSSHRVRVALLCNRLVARQDRAGRRSLWVWNWLRARSGGVVAGGTGIHESTSTCRAPLKTEMIAQQFAGSSVTAYTEW